MNNKDNSYCSFFDEVKVSLILKLTPTDLKYIKYTLMCQSLRLICESVTQLDSVSLQNK